GPRTTGGRRAPRARSPARPPRRPRRRGAWRGRRGAWSRGAGRRGTRTRRRHPAGGRTRAGRRGSPPRLPPLHASFPGRRRRMRIACLVFAKPPLPGVAKTRLAAAVGDDAAAALARAFLRDTWEAVRALDWRPVLLTTDPSAD